LDPLPFNLYDLYLFVRSTIRIRMIENGMKFCLDFINQSDETPNTPLH